MKHTRFERWLQNISKTQEEEISCSECFDLVSHFVEIDVAGEDAVAQMPQLKQHLDQCAVCREEYEILREVRHLDDEGGLPSLDDLQNLIH